MYLENIILHNYRNYGDINFTPSPNINYIYGENAQGKTNLLESIYYLLTAHSFKTKNEYELVKWGGSYLRIKGKVWVKGDISNINIYFSNNKEKKILVNGKEVKRDSFFSMFPVVIFHPEDLLMIKEGPLLRRKFLNREITRMYTRYWKYLQQYYRVLRQRNSLLKDQAVKRKDLESWDEILCFYGSKVVYLRMKFLNKLDKYFKEIHGTFTNNKEDVRLYYKSCVNLEEVTQVDKTGKDKITEKEIYNQFFNLLKDKQEEEIKKRYTMIGPQVEDFNVYINNKNIKKYASQGQQRTAVLSLKIALFNFLEENNKFSILLLDDVFSELDEKRKRAVLDFVEDKGLQCFITSYEKKVIPAEKNSFAVYKLDGGGLVNENSGKFN